VLTLTERERLIRRTPAELARRELAPDGAMRDRERRFPETWFAGLVNLNKHSEKSGSD
jgi:alkylation response protein AidB-like acyl-CoA dehydrogenase